MKPNPDPKHSVSGRLIALLRLFAEGEETLSIHEISEKLELAPSSVHRLLAGLVAEQIVERAAGRRYCLGREFIRMGTLATLKLNLQRLARPAVHGLAMATGETVVLLEYLPRPRQLVVADRVESGHHLRYRVAMGAARSLVWGAGGRMVLAWLGLGEIRDILARGEPAPVGGDMPPPLARLAPLLAELRKRGYEKSRGELVEGAVEIAAPIFDVSHAVCGALALTLPEVRLRRLDQARLNLLVCAAAAEISAALGAMGPRQMPLR